MPNELHSVLVAARGELRAVHHDLSNPLAIISGNLQLLQEVAGAEGASELIQASIGDAVRALEQFEPPLERLGRLRDRLQDLPND